jgi:hypothetical protein
MNAITARRLRLPGVGETSMTSSLPGNAAPTIVTQTQAESLVRMDVSVRAADAAEDTSLTTVTGFYGGRWARAEAPT